MSSFLRLSSSFAKRRKWSETIFHLSKNRNKRNKRLNIEPFTNLAVAQKRLCRWDSIARGHSDSYFDRKRNWRKFCISVVTTDQMFVLRNVFHALGDFHSRNDIDRLNVYEGSICFQAADLSPQWGNTNVRRIFGPLSSGSLNLPYICRSSSTNIPRRHSLVA